jgi:hypothetical protein
VNEHPTAQALPPLMQDAGIPFDVFIQALTEQLDKAQAVMTLKARVGKLPMTFAVKDISLDLRAYVRMVNDDVYVRPAGPGDVGSSSIKLALTTITKPMIEENAMSFQAEDPKFSLREALGEKINEEERRSLERIGVRSVSQLNDLRRSAGADVVARLARMPVNRLQQAMLAASAPRITRVERNADPAAASPEAAMPSRNDVFQANGLRPAPQPVTSTPATARPLPVATRMHIEAPSLVAGRVPLIRAGGAPVPVVQALDQSLIVQPLAHQLGTLAELDFGNGEVAVMRLTDGSVGQWHASGTGETT